jgi:hypothetical protein
MELEISTSTYNKLLDLVTHFSNQSTLELEGKYKSDVDKEAFARCIQSCKQRNLGEHIHPETLDVLTRLNDDVYRISVIGKDAIAQVYKTNLLPVQTNTTSNISFMKKTPVKGIKPLYLNDINFKVDLKNEATVDKSIEQELQLRFATLDKGYRFKKRYSYTDADAMVRYDFSIVRTSKYKGNEFVCHKTMSSSQVLTVKEAYEIEVEVLRGDAQHAKNAVTKSLFASMVSMYLRIHNESHYISDETKVDILKNYLRLCYSKTDESISSMVRNISFRPKEYFVGPQPVTLERKNVIEPGLGIVSVTQDYTVTEKADGERYLLFVNHDGRCYLINNRMSIKFTGVKLNTLTNSLFDGEWITSDASGRKINMYGIFDVYYYNKTDVTEYPLVSVIKHGNSRLDVMKTFSQQYKQSFESKGITVFAKDFKFDDNIFELSKAILDNEKSNTYPYKIDGLIFTPKHFAVGGQFLKDKSSLGRTWDMVFKWKPPHDNTVDFLLKYDKDESGNAIRVETEDKYHRVATLFVGYNPSVHDTLTAKRFLLNDIQTTKSYIPKEFCPGDVQDLSKAYLDIASLNVLPKCLNGDTIEDNSIVEFSFSAEHHWVPLRVRHDKTEMLRKFGLSHTANDYKTAMNVWSSIQHPVTVDIITGLHKIGAEDIVDEEVYFSSTLDRYKYASLTMKNFHNEYIKKRELILKMPKGAKLFDIACGKAGDLKKWIDGGFSKVFGIDVFRDNIENRKNGAYARTLEARSKFKLADKQFVYLTADASKRFTTEYIQSFENDDDKYIASILWGLNNHSKDPVLSKYFGFVKPQGFDVISCQFAIHYFFETMESLDNFIYNVHTYLKPGGYLIGTCLDGHRIKDKLSSIKRNQSIQGVRDDRVLWNIKKLYDNDDEIVLGEQVEIFMESIGKPIKEFLVDFNLLKAKLAEHKIDVLRPEECAEFGIEMSIESFKTSYNKVIRSDDKSQLAKDIRVMSEQEKEYSFLNSWFIFKKR